MVRAKVVRDEIERGVPADAFVADLRVEQPIFQRERFAKRRSLRAQSSEIGGMVWIARDGHGAVGLWGRQDTAANATIGAGSANGAGHDHSAAAAIRSPGKENAAVNHIDRIGPHLSFVGAERLAGP